MLWFCNNSQIDRQGWNSSRHKESRTQPHTATENSYTVRWIERRNPSYAKDRMRERKSQSDFSKLKFGKKVNISRDWVSILAEYKNGRNMQNFQIFTDRRRIGTTFIFEGFSYQRSKMLLHLIHFIWTAIASFQKFDFRLILFSVLRSRFFSPIQFFAHENSPRIELMVT